MFPAFQTAGTIAMLVGRRLCNRLLVASTGLKAFDATVVREHRAAATAAGPIKEG